MWTAFFHKKRNSRRSRRGSYAGSTARAPNLLLALASLCFAILLAELALRATHFNQPVRYAVWPPSLEHLVIPNEQDTPGITEPHEFKITPMGYRGKPIGRAALKILAFGGSTTESVFVPEGRSWPRLLESLLAPKLQTTVWVGNFGKSGRNTRQHVLDAEHVLPQFSAQVAIFLVGVNDLALLIDGHKPISLEEIHSDSYIRKSLVVQDGADNPSKFLKLVEQARRMIVANYSARHAPPPSKQLSATEYQGNRQSRAGRAGFSYEMPDLGPSLEEYERNLTVIADLVVSRGVLPVFISQPTLWSSHVSPRADALFWWGKLPGAPPAGSAPLYYSPETLERMMSAFNDRLRSMTSQRNVPFIDAARELPKDERYFYDEMHYNEAGSLALANVLAGELAAILKQRGILERLRAG